MSGLLLVAVSSLCLSMFLESGPSGQAKIISVFAVVRVEAEVVTVIVIIFSKVCLRISCARGAVLESRELQVGEVTWRKCRSCVVGCHR